MAMTPGDVIPIDKYPRSSGRMPRRTRGMNRGLGEFAYPVLNPQLGDLPTGDYQLQAGQLYTFIVRLDGRPNEANVADIISNNNKGIFFDLLSVTSTFGSYDYNIAVRMKKTMSYSQLVNLIRLWINVDLGYKVQEIDFKGGATPAPSIIQQAAQTVTAPITGVSQVATSLTSNVKWIAIAGLGILGIWAVLPALRTMSKKI